MLRQAFDQKLRRLQDKLLVLGSRVEENLSAAVYALRNSNNGQSAQVLTDFRLITRECGVLESDTLAILSTQQPMASDLRFLAAVLQICLELGRISYHSKEIAEINLKLGDNGRTEPYFDLYEMAELSRKMLHQALEAFARRDIALAQTTSGQDKVVDELFLESYNRLLHTIKTDPDVVSQAIFLSQVAHQLERVADRATNICEWVVFTVTGEMVDTKIARRG